MATKIATPIVLPPQLWIGNHEPLPEVLMNMPPLRNGHWKPVGGLWTSTYLPDGEHPSEWVRWCSSEMPNWIKGRERWLLMPQPARVFVIDGIGDLHKAMRCWPLAPIYRGADKAIDFTAMAEEYDAVRVTEEGHWRTRMTFPLNTYAWDCESTCWFRWCFERVEPMAN